MTRNARKATDNEARAEAGQAPAETYVMTADDLEAVKSFSEGLTLPEYGIANGALRVNHPSERVGLAKIAKAMGIQDAELYNGAIRQLVNVSTQGPERDADALNFAISIVRAIAPRDHLEVLLALQMTAIHIASMRHVRMMNHTETIPQLDIQERVVNKLMRTFATQMEALRKHRNGGSQRVIVKHVHVNEGGQAIIGNVSHGGRPHAESTRQSHEQQEHDDLSLPIRAALHGNLEEDREPMRSTSGKDEDGLPFPWRKGGRS